MNSNTQRHVHADLIRAWLDGKDVQVKVGTNWFDVTPVVGPGTIQFTPTSTYRIKPEVPLYKVSVFSKKGDMWVGSAFEKIDWEKVEKRENFSHWATEPFTLEKK